MKECISRKKSFLVQDGIFSKKYETLEIREHEFITEFERAVNVISGFPNLKMSEFKIDGAVVFCAHCGQQTKYPDIQELSDFVKKDIFREMQSMPMYRAGRKS